MPQPPVTQGEHLRLQVSGLAFGGQGIARVQDFVVFVDGGIPGDVLEVEVRRVRKRYAEARAIAVLDASPDRTGALCPHFGGCGGCRWQAMRYEAQLRYKEQHLRESLERLGGFRSIDMRPIRPMSDPWRYRNKVEFSAGRDEVGRPAIGFHPPGRWDTIVPVSGCMLIAEEMEHARAAVERWLRVSGAEPWDPRRRSGLLHGVIVRRSLACGDVLVGLSCAGPGLPESERLVEELRRSVPGLVGVIQRQLLVQKSQATSSKLTTLWGTDRLREHLDDLDLEISLDAFFQTNTAMAEVLYSVAAEEAGKDKGTVIWDLYSGIGSIALYLARTSEAVLGIEVNPVAVKDAIRNAETNRIANTHFLLGDVRKALKAILEKKTQLPAEVRRPDAVVLDPPRGGLAKKVVARVAEIGPARIVYVSCNPSTMAHDLTLFDEAGYRLDHVTPVDMFPHTPHIECVALMSKAQARA